MSLIADALRKVQRRSGFEIRTPTPPSPIRPWVIVGALVALGAVWFWALPIKPTRPVRLARRTPPAAAPQRAIPKPIMALLPVVPSTPSLAWRVDGVVTGMGTPPTAIINGKVVVEGDEVWAGAKVVSVNTQRVEILHDGKVVTLPLESERRP